MRARLLLNPAAGRGRMRKLLPRLERLARSWGVPVATTDGPGGLDSQAREAVASGCERLVVAGGDGTLHHVLAPLVGSTTALGIVPAGRGNDLASVLGLPRDPALALERALGADCRRIDVGKVAGRYFAGVAGMGLGSLVARLARNSYPRFGGRLVYPLALLRALRSFEPPLLEVEGSGGRTARRITLLAVANAPCFGGGMRVAPQARVDDGLLDLVVVDRITRRRLLRLFPLVYWGRHLGYPEVWSARAAEMEIRTVEPQELLGDGESMGEVCGPVRFSVVAGGLLVAA